MTEIFIGLCRGGIGGIEYSPIDQSWRRANHLRNTASIFSLSSESHNSCKRGGFWHDNTPLSNASKTMPSLANGRLTHSWPLIQTFTAKVEALNLTPEIETALYRYLIPTIYLDRVVDKKVDTQYRQQLRSRVATLLAPLHAADSPPAPLRTAVWVSCP